MPESNYTSVFATFDPYPSYKGSAIHIDKVTEVLSKAFPRTLVLSLPGHLSKLFPGEIDHLEADINETNYLKRGLAFAAWVDETLEQQFHLSVGHFRDIWSGLPIVNRPHITSVFEVNGLPSIELINRFPHLGHDTLQKIKVLEDECLQKSHLIVCPSLTIKNHLLSRKIAGDKIHVIPNGADFPVAHTQPEWLPAEYLVYFGALQPWQGIGVLLKAMQYLQDKPDLKLVICSSHKPKFSRPYQKLVKKLELETQIIWKHQMHKDQLYAILQHAICSVAPLTECSRNIEQGCSPLKIIESMANRTPIVASDLPVVREIVTPDTEAKLFRPDRPADLARCIRLLCDYPELRQTMSTNAYAKFEDEFTWETSNKKLATIYNNIFKLAY